MTEQKTNKRQTLGYFDIVGTIAVDSKCFALNQQSKNNINWFSNIFNPRIDGEGQNKYMRFQSGYDKVKGKKIFATSTSDTQLEIPFADRNNPNMIKLVNEKSFIRVAIGKKVEKNEKGEEYKTWEYKKYLDTFDAITFLSQMMPLASKNKVRITGKIRYSTYNGEIQENYDLQSIYLLDGNEEVGKELKPRFTFTQNVLITEGCVDDSKLDSEGVIKLNTKIYTKVKQEYKVLPLEMIMRANTEEKKNTYKRVVERYFTVDENTVRRINLDCEFKSGYSTGNVSEEDLPQEAKELIEDGLYSREEVLKMYVNKDRVNEMLVIRPLIRKIDGKPVVDFDDKEFEIKDLEGIVVEVVQEEIMAEENVDDLLSELENL